MRYRRGPLDRLYYHLPKRYPAYAARLYGIPMAPPNVDPERAFDKISLRTGFAEHDQYLLLDGCSGGNHSYEDTNAVVEFSQYGTTLLVTEDCLHRPEYRSHNVVTVTRNGGGAVSPSFAELGVAADFDIAGLLRTGLRDYNGVDWFRNLIWIKGACFAVLDELVARVPGHYAFQCHWRMLGDARLSGDALRVTRGPVEGVVANADGCHGWVEELDLERSTDHDPSSTWLRCRLLDVDRLRARAWHQRQVRAMAPGDRVVFHNLIYARAPDDPAGQAGAERHLRRAAEGCAVVSTEGSSVWLGRGCCAGELDTDALLFALGESWFGVAGARRLACGRRLLDAEAPVSAEMSLDAGVVTVEAGRPTAIAVAASLPLPPRLDGVQVEAQFEADGTGQWLARLQVPAGRHRVSVAPPGPIRLPLPPADHRRPVITIAAGGEGRAAGRHLWRFTNPHR